jgi:hypothetical protein
MWLWHCGWKRDWRTLSTRTSVQYKRHASTHQDRTYAGEARCNDLRRHIFSIRSQIHQSIPRSPQLPRIYHTNPHNSASLLAFSPTPQDVLDGVLLGLLANYSLCTSELVFGIHLNATLFLLYIRNMLVSSFYPPGAHSLRDFG